MVDAPAAPLVAPEARGPLVVGGAALVLLVGFRVGIVPGPAVGVDLALALLGWWIGSSVVDGAPPRRVLGAAWRMLWPAVLAAAAVAAAWAVVATSSVHDRLARGEGLAGVVGLANGHVLLNGPIDDRAHRWVSPLQHLWASSLVLQLLLVGVGLAAASRPLARRGAGPVDPLVPVALGCWLGVAAAGVAAAVLGTGGVALLVLPWFRAGALLLGLALGAAQRSPAADRLRTVVQGGAPLAGIVLLVAAVAGTPGGSAWPWLSLALPLAAVVVVGLLVPWPAGRRARTAPAAAARVDPLAARFPWAALVAYWALQAPAIGLVRAMAPGLADPLAALAGSLVALPLAGAVAFLAASLSDEPAAVERRRILGPPVAVAVLVLLLSATGAFHWSSPHLQPRSPVAGPR